MIAARQRVVPEAGKWAFLLGWPSVKRPNVRLKGWVPGGRLLYRSKFAGLLVKEQGVFKVAAREHPI